MIKRVLLATSIALSGTAVSFAADMPVKARSNAPVAYSSWTGWYVGGQVGGVWGSGQVIDTNGAVESTVTPSGIAAGFQGGYDYQFGPSWLMGVRADVAWANAKSTAANSFAPALPNTGELKYQATLVSRLGYVMNDNMFYVLGGVAWSNTKESFANAANTIAGSADDRRTGWVYGVGAEHKWTPNWTTFAEYNRAEYGSKTVTYTLITGGTATAPINNTYSNNFKAGVNYRF